MGVTEQRMEQLGITLQQTDWRGKGAVEAVLAGDMLYISAHYPVDENGFFLFSFSYFFCKIFICL